MMDRIIFLGTQIDDYTANTLQAQLLYLDSVDPGKDISIYINSPVALYMPGWVSMILCNSFPVMWQRYVPAWLQVWRQCCWWPVQKENARH